MWLLLQGLMEEALKRNRGIPRSYLLPSPAHRTADEHFTFAPEISARSKVCHPQTAAFDAVVFHA